MGGKSPGLLGSRRTGRIDTEHDQSLPLSFTRDGWTSCELKHGLRPEVQVDLG
jgi:hypothetical protein